MTNTFTSQSTFTSTNSLNPPNSIVREGLSQLKNRDTKHNYLVGKTKNLEVECKVHAWKTKQVSLSLTNVCVPSLYSLIVFFVWLCNWEILSHGSNVASGG